MKEKPEKPQTSLLLKLPLTEEILPMKTDSMLDYTGQDTWKDILLLTFFKFIFSVLWAPQSKFYSLSLHWNGRDGHQKKTTKLSACTLPLEVTKEIIFLFCFFKFGDLGLVKISQIESSKTPTSWYWIYNISVFTTLGCVNCLYQCPNWKIYTSVLFPMISSLSPFLLREGVLGLLMREVGHLFHVSLHAQSRWVTAVIGIRDCSMLWWPSLLRCCIFTFPCCLLSVY